LSLIDILIMRSVFGAEELTEFFDSRLYQEIDKVNLAHCYICCLFITEHRNW